MKTLNDLFGYYNASNTFIDINNKIVRHKIYLSGNDLTKKLSVGIEYVDRMETEFNKQVMFDYRCGFLDSPTYGKALLEKIKAIKYPLFIELKDGSHKQVTMYDFQ